METNKSEDKAASKPVNEQQNKPTKGHSSQGHAADSDETGSATNSKEPTLRSSTTDSSRMPKKSNDDLPTGGNIR